MDKKQIHYFAVIFITLFGYFGLDSLGLLKDSTKSPVQKELNYAMPRFSTQKSHEKKLSNSTSPNPVSSISPTSLTKVSSPQKAPENVTLDETAIQKAMKLSENMKTKKALKKKVASKKKKALVDQKNVQNFKMNQPRPHGSAQNTPKNNSLENVAAEMIPTSDIAQEIAQENNTSVIPSVHLLLSNYKKGKINEEAFFSVLEILMMENNVDTQSQILRALYGVYSVRSFIFASQNQNRVVSTLKSKFRNYLYTYSSLENLLYLRPVLTSGQNSAILDASKVFIMSLEQSKSSKNPKYKTLFSKFYSVFQKLRKAGNISVAQSADQILSELGTLSVAISVNNLDSNF